MRWLDRLDPRSGRLVTAALSGFAGRFANIVSPLLAMPAMLAYMGDYDFGIWATAVSITSIAVIADLGIGNGLLTRVAAAHGRNDVAAIRSYTSSAYAALSAVAGTLLAATLLGFWILGGSAILLAVFGAFFLQMPGMAFHQFLYGSQRVPLSNALLTLGAVGAVLACLGAIALGLPGWGVVLAFALPTALAAYAGAAWFYLRHPEYRPSAAAVNRRDATDLLKLGARFFALSILTAIGLNVDNIIISTMVGPEAVTAYAIPQRLGTAVLSLVIVALFMPLWGANGGAIAKGEHAWVRRSTLRMSAIGVAVILSAGGVLLLASDFVIRLWVGRVFEDQALVLGAMIFTGAVMAATSPFNMILNAMGKATVQIWPWLAFVIVSVAAKVAILSPAAIWPLALVTGVVYLLVITPAMIFASRRALAADEAAWTAGRR